MAGTRPEGRQQEERTGRPVHGVHASPGVAEHSFCPTPREFEILRLVACHTTNPEIADQLSISSRTIMHHVSQLLAKLGVTNRRSSRSRLIVQRDSAADTRATPSVRRVQCCASPTGQSRRSNR
jgi:DNA-binding NarL/FixJ family response regulator